MEFLTRKQVAKYFSVSERTIDRWINSGNLKGYKLGTGKTSLLRIPKSEIKNFLERSKIK
jgi:excisionase family DNA binding protein